MVVPPECWPDWPDQREFMNVSSHIRQTEVGGISLVLIYGAALVAAVANPLTKRRLEAHRGALMVHPRAFPKSWLLGAFSICVPR